MLEQQYNLRHLTEKIASEVRQRMLEELHWSLESNKIYFSKHFSPTGEENYPHLLKNALESGNPNTLEESLNLPGNFEPDSPRKAAQTFAWDEFNKYYMRALCRLAQELAGYELIVVRGRQSRNPKPESDRLIGAKKDPVKLLNGLRNVPKVNPFGANSGLTLELRKAD
jgi:hypothetical protein